MTAGSFPAPLAAERRAAIQYLAAAAMIFVALGAIIPGALLRLWRLGPTTHSSESSRWIHALDQRKRELSAMGRAPKIHLISGSGALYSVRAQGLVRALGVPVLNNALHAGLGLAYLLYRARQVVRPGDAVLLMLEYESYRPAPLEWTLADFVLPLDLGYLVRLDFRSLRRLVGKLTPAEYGLRVHDALLGTRIDIRALAAGIDRYGDLRLNLKAARNDAHRSALAAYRPLVTADALRGRADAGVPAALPAFIAWCREQGVGIIASFPAALDFPEYHTPEGRVFFASVPEYFREFGVPVLGSPFDFMFPRELFFDTGYHLDDEGAARMTERIAAELREILARRSPEAGLSDGLRLPAFVPLVVDLSEPGLPAGLSSLSGFAERENWGRWTDGQRADLVLEQPLPPRFRLIVETAHVFGANLTEPTRICIGRNERSARLGAAERTTAVDFALTGEERVITFLPPHPQSPRELGTGDDPRRLGIGLSLVKIEPLP